MEIKIDSLITRGMMHELRCEDDLLIYENDEVIFTGVFDGCSSGKDSHYASTFIKNELYYLLKTNDIFIVREDNNRNFPYREPKDVVKVVLTYLFDTFKYINYEVNNEMLSTCVICYVNKITNEYAICFAGDGECCIDNELHVMHDAGGNSVWYLSTVKDNELKKYINEYCTIYDGQFNDKIVISTDGIATFIDKYNCNKSEEVRNLFYETSDSYSKYKGFNSKRIYNLLCKGKINGIDEQLKNLDDFTIIKIKRLTVM